MKGSRPRLCVDRRFPACIGRAALALALVATLSPVGAQAAFADPVTPYWETPDPTAIDSTLIKTYGVRDGSAGPDFLGITNTNFDFTEGPYTSPLQYTGTTAAQLDTVTGVGLAIWATTSIVYPNPYYQNLYYNIAMSPTPSYIQATTWMTNPVGLWGDSNASPSNKGNVSTGAPTIAGLEYNPDIIFGADKFTAWGNQTSDGSGSQTIFEIYFNNNPGTIYTPNPVWTSNDATNIYAQIYTLGQLAMVADALKGTAANKTTRYGALAVTSAVDYEKAIRGNLLYIASQLYNEEVERKTVAYLYSIDQNNIGYFFTPTATDMLVGNDTGKAPTTVANPDPNYAANNGTIVFGYRSTLPFITDTFDSGNPFTGGITMAVEDIWKSNPACTVESGDSLADVDVLIYNTTTLQDLVGTTDGRNNSGVGINGQYQNPAYVYNWLTSHGFTGTLIAGDDFATGVNQGYGTVDATDVGMSPLLYCQRNYTADKNAKAVWAFAQVYPELYLDSLGDPNPDATYGYWLEKVYHIDMADLPTVGAYMTNQSDTFNYDADMSTALEGYFETGYDWWTEIGSTDPDWSQFAFYSGSTRASYYSGLAASEEPANTIGILAPSIWWQSSHPDTSHYAYSIGHNFGIDIPLIVDDEGDFTPNVDYAATVYAMIGYSSQYSYNSTHAYLKGKNPAGQDRLGSPVVFLNGHASYYNLLLGDAVDPPERRCGVCYGTDFTSGDTGYTYAGLQSRNLSNVKLISFVGCETASTSDNLCTRAVAGGNKADAALGFIDNIHSRSPEGQLWLQKYNDALAFGYTVDDAVEYAKALVSGSDLSTYADVIGKGWIVITP
jgi:hypothetical protein